MLVGRQRRLLMTQADTQPQAQPVFVITRESGGDSDEGFRIFTRELAARLRPSGPAVVYVFPVDRAAGAVAMPLSVLEAMASDSAYHSCGQCQGRAACTHVILEDLVEAAGKQEGVDERGLRRRGSILEHEKQASTQLAEISGEIVRREWSHF